MSTSGCKKVKEDDHTYLAFVEDLAITNHFNYIRMRVKVSEEPFNAIQVFSTQDELNRNFAIEKGDEYLERVGVQGAKEYSSVCIGFTQREDRRDLYDFVALFYYIKRKEFNHDPNLSQQEENLPIEVLNDKKIQIKIEKSLRCNKPFQHFERRVVRYTSIDKESIEIAREIIRKKVEHEAKKAKKVAKKSKKNFNNQTKETDNDNQEELLFKENDITNLKSLNNEKIIQLPETKKNERIEEEFETKKNEKIEEEPEIKKSKRIAEKFETKKNEKIEEEPERKESERIAEELRTKENEKELTETKKVLNTDKAKESVPRTYYYNPNLVLKKEKTMKDYFMEDIPRGRERMKEYEMIIKSNDEEAINEYVERNRNFDLVRGLRIHVNKSHNKNGQQRVNYRERKQRLHQETEKFMVMMDTERKKGNVTNVRVISSISEVIEERMRLNEQAMKKNIFGEKAETIQGANQEIK